MANNEAFNNGELLSQTTTHKETNGNSNLAASSNNETSNNQDESITSASGDQDESSTISTAFTISFGDDNNSSKKFGIRDSIRKFAPPKPHTIEKPRPSKNDSSNQENSLTSIESAPAGLCKDSSYRGGAHSNSSRSSGRRSNSSRHSNLSESASFLINKMLNCNKSQRVEDEESLASLINQYEASKKFPTNHKRDRQLDETKAILQKRLSSDKAILDNEVDFSEDKSDNGTYIVGTDPESEAARKKIDELFGVVRAAEASVIAESKLRNSANQGARQSRLTEKKPLSRERQEHINRLACRTSSSVSRSSSSSHRENNISSTIENKHHTRHRSSSRNSRNSSCDPKPKPTSHNKQRRSASQTSRQSSTKELSDGDTRSSRSSLHNDELDGTFNENSMTAHPNMKFNRAFALRRARLGLSEPTTSQTLIQDVDATCNNLSSNRRRHQINTNTYRVNQNSAILSSAGAGFSRDDGGRFSLRMKASNLPSRLNSAYQQHKSQHGNLFDAYISKVSAGPKMGLINNSTPLQDISSRTPTKIPHSPYTSSSAGMPYQSGDEYEKPSRFNRMLFSANQSQQGHKRSGLTSEQEGDSDWSGSKFNYSNSLMDYEFNSNSENRANSSIGCRRGSAVQIGALDSLVISAISSLSLKIRTSVCDVLSEQAKKLPIENETRSVVEEILPQLTADPYNPKSPTSMEEIDQSLYFDLAKTLKNLKKVEQMVDVIGLISNQLPPVASYSSHNEMNSSLRNTANFNTIIKTTGKVRSSDNITNEESTNDLSSV